MDSIQKEMLRNDFSIKWLTLTDEIASVFHLSKKEQSRIHQSPAARLAAELAFLARCNDPERVALANVGLIIIATRNDRFRYSPGEGLYNRMVLINNYPGGNEAVVDAGMIILQLISLYDHYRDQEQDNKAKKYNPLVSGELNFEEEKNSLLSNFKKIDNKIQEMFRGYLEFLPYAWWVM